MVKLDLVTRISIVCTFGIYTLSLIILWILCAQCIYTFVERSSFAVVGWPQHVLSKGILETDSVIYDIYSWKTGFMRRGFAGKQDWIL